VSSGASSHKARQKNKSMRVWSSLFQNTPRRTTNNTLLCQLAKCTKGVNADSFVRGGSQGGGLPKGTEGRCHLPPGKRGGVSADEKKGKGKVQQPLFDSGSRPRQRATPKTSGKSGKSWVKKRERCIHVDLLFLNPRRRSQPGEEVPPPHPHTPRRNLSAVLGPL